MLDSEEFLKSAEELVESPDSQEELILALNQAENRSPDDLNILCKSARILFRHGILNSQGQCVLLALDKIKRVEERNPLFFDAAPIWLQLWGNILVHLSKLLQDTSFLEQALEKFQCGSKNLQESTLFWDWGEAWVLLGQKSGEPSDFKQGLAKFAIAKKMGVESHFFALDYAAALQNYSDLVGDPAHLEQAIRLLQGVIKVAEQTDTDSVAFVIAWRQLARAMKAQYLCTHRADHFDQADSTFRDAILATPKNGLLWLDWGELFLHDGWIKQDFKQLEIAFEKLSASKIKECDPISVSLIYGKGMILLGLFLENLKLLKEGQERILEVLKKAPHLSQVQNASALAEMSLGIYFSDEIPLSNAAQVLEKAVRENAHCVESWLSLFQIYVSWAIKAQDTTIAKKAIAAIARLCELRPFSYRYLNAWGVALLRLRNLEESLEDTQGYLEEAVLKLRAAHELYEDEETVYNLGCAYDLLGDLIADEEHCIKGIDYLTAAFEKRPSEPHIRYRLGLAYSHLGELTHNAECLKQAVELIEPVSAIQVEDEIVWSELGYALLCLSELVMDESHPHEGESLRQDAEKALLHAAELGSGNACYHLACLYSLSGYYEASISYLKKAEKSDYLHSREDLEHDEWLANVRETEAFHDFITTWENDG